jgi:soluble lytic murein transglycosylase-like protein
MNSFLICLTALSMNLHNAEIICKNSVNIAQEAEINKIKPSLIIAVGIVESRWTPTARSYSNACGVMQILPKYSKKFSNKDRNLTCEELKDPETSIEVGAKILNFWYYKYSKRDKITALCGYNAGFRCKGKNKNKQGLKYAKAVLRWESEFKNIFKIQKKQYKFIRLFGI